MFQLNRSFSAMIFAVLLALQADVDAASISINYPDNDTNYNVGAPISYRGEGSWSIDNTPPRAAELRTEGVFIDLLWFDKEDTPDSSAIVMDSDEPILTYDKDEFGHETGEYTFANSRNGSEKSNLTALPRSDGNGGIRNLTYKIRARPYRKSGLGYPKAPNTSVMDYKTLGLFS